MLRERHRVAVGKPQALAALPPKLDAIAAAGAGVDRDVKARLAVPRARGEIGGAEALRRRREVDRLEQARLAGAVAAEQQVSSFAGCEGGIGEVAEGAGI